MHNSFQSFPIVDGKMAMFQCFKRVDGQYPGSKLPDPQGVLAQEVPSLAISAANTEVACIRKFLVD